MPTAQGLIQRDPLPPGAGRTNTFSYLLDSIRVRPFGRRVLSLAAISVFIAAGITFTFPLFSNVYTTSLVQEPLVGQLETPQSVEQYVTRTIEVGAPVTRIVIPTIGVDMVVVEGTSPAALRAGAGHYPRTPLPGELGNVAIAGHRTTYGRPFNRLDEMVVGDTIELHTPLAHHTYTVVDAPEGVPEPCPEGACWIVQPDQWEVVGPRTGAMLTLTTCHPEGSMAQRLVIRAELAETVTRRSEAEQESSGE